MGKSPDAVSESCQTPLLSEADRELLKRLKQTAPLNPSWPTMGKEAWPRELTRAVQALEMRVAQLEVWQGHVVTQDLQL